MAIVLLAAGLAVPAATAAGSELAACVGQFSSFFAHGGGGTHRSDVARDFAANDHPAGHNVYSEVAKGHGSLESCFEQF